MTEPQHPSGDRPVYQPLRPPPPRRTRPLAWLFTLVLLAAAGYGAWRGAGWAVEAWHSARGQQDLIERLEREVAALRTQQSELAAGLEQGTRSLGSLAGRIDQGEHAVARLADMVDGGRASVQLAAVEQLLLMANDRLLLAQDGRGALRALDLADQRLAALNDPRLFKVREALTGERAALAQLALPDVAGLTLSLAEILRRAPELPLRARVPERFDAQSDAIVPPPDAGGLERLWAAVKTALANVFTLRRHEGARPRLLPAEEEALVVQLLALKLEGARLALLASDTRTFQELVEGARRWLAEYYDETDPGVRAARAELERMAALNLAPALPDISRSLALLRGLLGAPAR